MQVRRLWLEIVQSPGDPAATIARLALGAMIIPHGMQLLLGSFGGPGFRASMAGFTSMGIPAFLAFLAIVAQFFGGIALLLGLLGRVAALGIGVVMVVAVITVHAQHGFFMNWAGTLPAGAEGWEFHLLAIALSLVVAIQGSGAWSIDRILGGAKRQSGP